MMNKYQEAINDVINNAKDWNIKNDSFWLLQELVDKATPNKLIDEWHCPCCRMPNERVLHPVEIQLLPNYCPHCGQAIDWSNNED